MFTYPVQTALKRRSGVANSGHLIFFTPSLVHNIFKVLTLNSYSTSETERVIFMENITLLKVYAEYLRYYQNPYNRYDYRSKVTIQSYFNRYLLLLKFLQYRNTQNLKASEFTPQVGKLFFNSLAKKYKHNYAARIVGSVSTVMDWAVNEGVMKFNPLSSFSISKEPPKKAPYLTPLQMREWENYRSDCVSKQKAADIFTLIINTGFDYGDLSEIRRSHVVFFKGQKYIIKPRHKNGNEAIIPLNSTAERVLEKYDYRVRLMSNPRLNHYIKDVAKDLDHQIYVTLKAGRKIFMMNKLNNEGYSMEAVSKMGGHRGVKTTEAYYAQVNINLVHNEVSNNGKFNYIS